jgi:hypothetical protein
LSWLDLSGLLIRRFRIDNRAFLQIQIGTGAPGKYSFGLHDIDLSKVLQVGLLKELPNPLLEYLIFLNFHLTDDFNLFRVRGLLFWLTLDIHVDGVIFDNVLFCECFVEQQRDLLIMIFEVIKWN